MTDSTESSSSLRIFYEYFFDFYVYSRLLIISHYCDTNIIKKIYLLYI
jgi:hypothetical protein